MASKIFISYRRRDTAAVAGRLYDFLAEKFGSDCLFKDVDTIPYGRDFVEEINKAIDNSAIVLVMVGRYFLTDEKRLFRENDYVRYEIAYALQQGKIVIPILVNDALMPPSSKLPSDIQRLSTINGPELRNSKWRVDCLDFYEHLKRLYKPKVSADVAKELKKAEEFYNADNYDAAFPIYYKYREEEAFSAKAQVHLGYMYDKGKGVVQNYEEAAKWYRKAADRGYNIGQFNLGVSYDNGHGVKQDYQEAINWYKKAADQGYASAQYNLGVIYDNGKGVKQDYQQAIVWYEKAANQGYVKAQYNLGVIYDNGKRVKQDYQQAIVWYEKAAN
ncbi:MAG: toll/interleukin-1 receptor domain-containing protein, partial [Bacteroidota bacterium]